MAKVAAADLDTAELGPSMVQGSVEPRGGSTAPKTPPIRENGWTQGIHLPPLTTTAPTDGPAVVWPSGTTHSVRFGPSSTATTMAVAKENMVARALFGQEGYASWVRMEKRTGLASVCHAGVTVGYVLGPVAMALNDPGHPSILVAALFFVPSSIEYALTKIPRAMSEMNRSFTVIFSTINMLAWSVCMSAVRGWHTADCAFCAGWAVHSYLAGITADATGSRAEFAGTSLSKKCCN